LRGEILKGLFGSRVLKDMEGEIFNLTCLVQFLKGEGRGEEGSKFYYTAKIILRLKFKISILS